MIKTPLLTLLVFCSCLNAQVQKKSLFDNCGKNPQAVQLARLIAQYQGQNRKKMICNKVLSNVAAYKAQNMAEQNQISHYVNNKSPNELLRLFGVDLPNNYAILGNQVEAVSGGVDSAQEAFDFFLTSEDHKHLILGEGSPYQQQDQFGVGYYKDRGKKHEYYWVVYTTSLKNRTIKEELAPKFIVQMGKHSKAKPKRLDLLYSKAKRSKETNESVKASSKIKL